MRNWLSITVALAAASAQAAHAGGWQPAQPLGMGVINDATSAMNAGGAAVVVWNACPPTNSTCGKFLSRTRPAGGAFGPIETATNKPGPAYLDSYRWLSLADSGLATLVRATDTGMTVWRKAAGKPWSPPVAVVSGSGDVASDHVGDVAIYSGNQHVYLSRAGGRFVDLGIAVTSTPALPRIDFRGVTVAASGDVVVAWTNWQCRDPNRAHCASVSAGQSYGARLASGTTRWDVKPIGPPSTALPQYKVHLDDSGRAAVVAYSNWTSELSGYHQLAGSQPWTASATTFVDGFLADTIAVDGAGRFTALISNNNTNANVLWAGSVTGTPWTQQHVVPSPAYRGFRLAVSPAGSAVLSWTDAYTDGTYKLTAITRPAATPTWSAPQVITSATSDGLVFMSGASSNGSALTISSIGSPGLIGSVYQP